MKTKSQPENQDLQTLTLNGDELHIVQFILDWAWRSDISEYMTAESIQAAESAMKKLGVNPG